MEQDRLEAFMSLIVGASRSITKIKTRGMANYDLGSTHTICLRVLYKSANGITRTQLSKKCDLDKAQISRIINELVDKNYVTENSEKTGYKKKIVLTEQGRKITEEINALVLSINNRVSGDIPSDEIEIFYNVFTTICNNLKKEEDKFNTKD